MKRVIKEMMVTYDRDRAAEFVLALMYLDVHDDVRAWKGYPWDVLEALHERGLILQPKSKAKSVVLTHDGLARAAAAFDTLLATRRDSARRNPAARSASRLSQLQMALVEKLLASICAPHPDPAVSSKLRHGFRIEDYSVVLFESRPGFRAPHEW